MDWVTFLLGTGGGIALCFTIGIMIYIWWKENDGRK